MEMYADPTSRAGVLEPEGVVEIRFREKDLIKSMERCDTQYAELCKQFADLKDSNPEEAAKVQKQLIARKQLLLRMFKPRD